MEIVYKRGNFRIAKEDGKEQYHLYKTNGHELIGIESGLFATNVKSDEGIRYVSFKHPNLGYLKRIIDAKIRNPTWSFKETFRMDKCYKNIAKTDLSTSEGSEIFYNDDSHI